MTDPVAALRSHQRLVLETLVRLLWADGRLAPQQVAAVEAAGVLLDEPEVAPAIVRRADRELAPEPYRDLSPELRPLLLVAAAWVAAADRRDHPAEQAVLDRLAEILELSPDLALRLQALARRMVGAVHELPAPAQLEALLRGAHRLHPPEEVAA